MRAFTYERADTLDAALAALTGDDVKPLAGGTNLVDLMKLGVERPSTLVDVTALGLDDVSVDADGAVRIGSGVRNSDLAAHPEIRRRFPVLSQALLAGASGQLRNMATTGGNLLQRTRCTYFQDVSKPCNKRVPGSGCPAREGDHRNLAILGASPDCVATHPSDMAVALAALDAQVEIAGRQGNRTVPVTDLLRLPGADPTRDHTLEPDEIITAVVVPPLPSGARSSYTKVRDRASYAFALVSVAAVLVVDAGRITDARIALGGVAAKPWRASRAEDVLRGAPATPESFTRAASVELEAADPLPLNEFKVPLARRVIAAALDDLTQEVSS